MIRMPLGCGVIFNILLLFAALSGMLGPGGIFVLIINIILMIPALLRYFEYVEIKKNIKRRRQLLIEEHKTQIAHTLIGSLIQVITISKEDCLKKLIALVQLNDFFVEKNNRKHLHGLTD